MSGKLEILVNGKSYSGFTGATVTSSLRELSRSFVLDAVGNAQKVVPFDEGDPCEVFVDGEQFLSGYIEDIVANGDESTHKISISGRDKLADLVDGYVNVLGDLKPPLSIVRCLEHVLGHLGMSDVEVIDTVGGDFIRFATLAFDIGSGNAARGLSTAELFNAGEDVIVPEPGEKAIKFLHALALKRHCLLTADYKGNILVTRAVGDDIDARIVHKAQEDQNNVLSYTFTKSHRKRYNRYIDLAQGSVEAATSQGSVTAGRLVNASGMATDNAIRASRQYVFESEMASSEGEAKDRSAWELAIRKAQGHNYQCNVDGYKDQQGKQWTIGSLVHVEDDFQFIKGEDGVRRRLNEKMLVDKVSFILDETNGHNTNLRLVPKDVYFLES